MMCSLKIFIILFAFILDSAFAKADYVMSGGCCGICVDFDNLNKFCDEANTSYIIHPKIKRNSEFHDNIEIIEAGRWYFYIEWITSNKDCSLLDIIEKIANERCDLKFQDRYFAVMHCRNGVKNQKKDIKTQICPINRLLKNGCLMVDFSDLERFCNTMNITYNMQPKLIRNIELESNNKSRMVGIRYFSTEWVDSYRDCSILESTSQYTKINCDYTFNLQPIANLQCRYGVDYIKHYIENNLC